MRHVKAIEYVHDYDKESKFPWVISPSGDHSPAGIGRCSLCLLISILAERFCRDTIVSTVFGTILDLQILRDPVQNRTTVLVIVDIRGVAVDEEPGRWTRLDSEFNKINGQIRQAKFVLGFDDRVEMARFATNILAEKMPSICSLADVRYSICILDDDKESWDLHDKWYRASLDSEELTGTPFVSHLF